jgi:uncharacterized protein YecE (DUF72 family)
MMLYWGTCGFSYADWAGIVYPKGLPRRDWLSYYASQFNALELNSSYYAIPGTEIIKAMIAKTGEGFMFSVKANQEMTHQRLKDDSVFIDFIKMLQPFLDAGKLGCILAQFPYSFHFNRDNQDYIEMFRKRLDDLPLVVEFRNVEWIKPEIYAWLKSNNIGFCCVDEPRLPGLIPPVAEVTSDIGYVRFHGRNAGKWWEHENAYERYDYSYTEEELTEWIPRLKTINSQSQNTFIFTNNHWRGQAVNTIRQLKLAFD